MPSWAAITRGRPLVPLAVFWLAALALLDCFHPRFLRPPIPQELASKIGQVSLWDGEVLAPPEAANSGFRTVIFLKGRGEGTKILLRTGGDVPPSVGRGDRIRFSAKLKKPARYRNPGSFDYRRYLERQGIVLTAFVEDPSSIEKSAEGSEGFFRWFDRFRTAVRGRYFAALPSAEAGFLTALITGDRSGLTPELWNDFRRTGTAHLIAISGQHIAIVAGVAYAVFLWLLKRSERLMLRLSVRALAWGLALVPVVFYALLAGAPPSAVRAAVLVALVVAAFFLNREAEAWSALAFAAILIAVWDPAALFSASFQLSFLAVAGILLFQREASGFASRGAINCAPTRTQRYLMRPFWLTAGATLATAPLVAYRFHEVSLSGILTNLWAVPAVGLLLVMAAAALAFPILSRPLEWTTGLFLEGVHRSAEISWVASFYPTEAETVLCLLFAGWLAWWRRRPGDWKRILTAGGGLSLLGLIVLGFDPGRPERGALQVTFLDVGQGDAALIVSPTGRSLLIDGGGFLIPWGMAERKSSFDIGKREIVPYLKRLGIKRLDAVLLSHPHPDHFGGLTSILREFPVGEFWWSGQTFPDASFGELMEIVSKQGILKKILKADDTFDWAGCRMAVLYPEAVRPTRTINNNSLVVRLSFGEASILFPGDIEKGGETTLADHVPIQATILKIPHHASRTSSSVPFIDSVRPAYAVASLGEGNLFGFPHEGILEKYERRGTKVFRTDRHGAVTMTIGPDFPRTPVSIRSVSFGR